MKAKFLAKNHIGMKKNIYLLLIIFTLFQLPGLLKAQQIQRNIYLKLGDIRGSSTTTYAPGLINISQFAVGASCSSCTVENSSVTGLIVPGKIVITLNNSAEVIRMKESMLSSQPIISACFVFTFQGNVTIYKEQADYWVTLSNVVVEKVSETGDFGSAAAVQVTLSYQAITYTVQRYSPTNIPVGPRLSTGWDFRNNTELILPIPTGL
jgi:hypothetical protein